MNRRGMRRSRALMGGMAIMTAVVVGEAGPAPAQVPDVPDVSYVDGYGPSIFGYADCTDVVHVEEELAGAFFVEVDEPVEADTELALVFGGSLAGSLVETPLTATIPEGEVDVFVDFELVEFETGDLTLTIAPGAGYTAGPEDTNTLVVTDEVVESISCRDDLGWLIVEGRDRQTIEVGEVPRPLGLFEDVVIVPGEPYEETTTSVSTTETPTTTTEAVDLTASRSGSAPPSGRCPRASTPRSTAPCRRA